MIKILGIAGNPLRTSTDVLLHVKLPILKMNQIIAEKQCYLPLRSAGPLVDTLETKMPRIWPPTSGVELRF